jgi:hypothetical protein
MDDLWPLGEALYWVGYAAAVRAAWCGLGHEPSSICFSVEAPYPAHNGYLQKELHIWFGEPTDLYEIMMLPSPCRTGFQRSCMSVREKPERIAAQANKRIQEGYTHDWQ